VTERRRISGAVLSATAALGVLLGIRPLPVERLLSIYVLVLAAIVLAALTRIAAPPEERRRPSPFEDALRVRPERPMRPPELVRTERELTLGMASAGHAYRRLLPLLREAAAARLATGHGVELGRRPESARALLGEDAWELLRPDLPEPEDRNALGLPFARMEAVIGRLESL
jgi:hypothetical protein